MLHQGLLKTIFKCLNYSSNLILIALPFTKTSFESTEQVASFGGIVETTARMRSRSLTTHYVRLMGQKDATSLGDFPAFSNGMILATLQIRGQWANENNELNMDSISWRTKRTSDLRNEGGMLSGPAAPLPFIFLMADNNSPIWSVAPAFIANKWCFKTFFELSVDVTIELWYIEFADPSVLVYEDVGFGFDVSDGSTVMGRCFDERVGISSAV